MKGAGVLSRLLVAALLALAPAASADSPATSTAWRDYLGDREAVEVGSGALRGVASRGWVELASRAVALADAHLDEVATAFGLARGELLPIWIVVSPGDGRFALEAPAWSAAIARPQRGWIVLSGPALSGSNLRETVVHELVHLAVHARIGEIGWLPRWLHEGLAVHHSHPAAFRDRWVRWGRGPIHLTEITDTFPRNDRRAHLAYLESEAAVRRLLQLGSLEKFLDRIAAGEEFEDAFVAVYGIHWLQFADDVHEEVSRRWRIVSVLTSSGTVFGLLTLLFVVGGIRTRLRNRRRRRVWEAEEAALEAGDAPPGERAQQ